MKHDPLTSRHRKRSMLIAAGFLLGFSSAAQADEDHAHIELRWHSTATATAARSEETSYAADILLTSSQTISVDAAMAHTIGSSDSAVFYGIGYPQRSVQLESDFRLSDC